MALSSLFREDWLVLLPSGVGQFPISVFLADVRLSSSKWNYSTEVILEQQLTHLPVLMMSVSDHRSNEPPEEA